MSIAELVPDLRVPLERMSMIVCIWIVVNGRYLDINQTGISYGKIEILNVYVALTLMCDLAIPLKIGLDPYFHGWWCPAGA